MSDSAPPLKADRGYLEAFTELMKRLAAATRGANKALVVCVAGGAAVHLYTGSRVSKDVDAKVMARFIPPDNLEVSYEDRDGHARLLYFDTQYNDSYALLHEDAYEDAIPIALPGIDPARLDVRLLSPVDLAVSKLSGFEAHDQEDLRALAREGLITGSAVRRRAEEALPAYAGDVARVKSSIARAEQMIDKVRPG
jgi:hypothetical protein